MLKQEARRPGKDLEGRKAGKTETKGHGSPAGVPPQHTKIVFPLKNWK